VTELTPNAAFADFGVDSLLSLTISGRLREELDLDVESSLFNDCPTVKDLLVFLPVGPSTVTAQELQPMELSASACSSTYPSTPDTASESAFELIEAPPSSSATSIADDDDGVMATIRQILAEEIGVKESEITGSQDLGDFGMDSLLSLTVLGRLRELLSMEIPSDLFANYSCLDAIEAALGLRTKSAQALAPAPATKTPVREVHELAASPIAPHSCNPIPRASSILVQGNPKTATKTLFLFPDGSGSATSYAPLPKISPDVAVYGLNCPFMKRPQDMKCSLNDLTTPYLDELRRRQPHGPYYLGGWSAGGIQAYDAAQKLIADGEAVDRLILIDSPNPIGLEKLPARLYDFFNSVGLFGKGEKAPPSWLLPHFLAFIDALDAYKPVPFPADKAPKTFIIWARDGVCPNDDSPRPEMRDDDPREMKWLLNNRDASVLGPNGWDRLLGSDALVIQTLSNANHFNMCMDSGKARGVSAFIEDAMA